MCVHKCVYAYVFVYECMQNMESYNDSQCLEKEQNGVPCEDPHIQDLQADTKTRSGAASGAVERLRPCALRIDQGSFLRVCSFRAEKGCFL